MWNIRSFLFANQANVLTRRRDNCDTVRKAKEIRGMRGLKVDIEKFRNNFALRTYKHLLVALT